MCDKKRDTSSRLRIVVRDIPAARLWTRYRLPGAPGSGCAGCPRYGSSWVCPPFADAEAELPHGYRRVLVAACVAATADEALRGVDALYERMLDLERRLGGRAFGVPGGCRQCGGAECSRMAGRPCRHPERARASLEALGIDLCALSAEEFGLPLQWNDDSYVVMITAVMY